MSDTAASAAGEVRQIGPGESIEDHHFEWTCGLCNTTDTAFYKDGAWANLINHVSRSHMREVLSTDA